MLQRIVSILAGITLVGLGWISGVWLDGTTAASKVSTLEQHNKDLAQRILSLKAEVKTAWNEYHDMESRYRDLGDRSHKKLMDTCNKADQMILDLASRIESYKSSRSHVYLALLLAEKAIIEGKGWDEYQKQLTGHKLDSRDPAQVDKSLELRNAKQQSGGDIK